jgi:uncharacterized lipoprotein YmbA
MKKAATGLLLVALASGCAMKETKTYSLNLASEALAQQSISDATVAVVVSSPRHLSQPYIVYRESLYTLDISRYAKWQAPPDDMLRDAIKDPLANSLFREVRTTGSPRRGMYALKINLTHFERWDEADASYAEVAFVATFLSPQGKILFQQDFKRKTKLEDRRFASLAKGLSSSLDEAISELKASLAKAMLQ